MKLVCVSVFAIFCIPLACAQFNISVPLCFQTGVQWTVSGVMAGGVTYVETTQNSSCVFTVTGTATQTFLTNYTLCQTSPSITLGGTLHEFIIVLQNNSNFNAATDERWLVRCEFNTATTAVSASFVGRSNEPSGTPGKNVTTTVDPSPVLSLYTTVNNTETLVTTSTVLELGTNVTARITLDRNTTDYNMLVRSGEMSSQIIGQISILSTVQVLDVTTYCALHDVFMSFEYLLTPENVRYAETTFRVFLPTVASINLQTTNLQLRLSFRVELCLVGSGCVQGACADRSSTRRRRQISDESSGGSDNQTTNRTFDLDDGFQVVLQPNAGTQNDPSDPVIERGTNQDSVCLDKSEFWGLIMGLIGFLILASLASCCFCFYFLRCRQRTRESKKLSETSSIKTSSTVIGNRVLVEEQAVKPSFILPRFVPIFGEDSKSY